jgi:hypothetical protein
VADGHDDEGVNGRIVKFSKDGTFIKTWGKRGSAPGEFIAPHGLAFDSKGRLFVADRANNRIQIFDQDGKFLEEWKQFSRLTSTSTRRRPAALIRVERQAQPRLAARHPRRQRTRRQGDAFIPDPELAGRRGDGASVLPPTPWGTSSGPRSAR